MGSESGWPLGSESAAMLERMKAAALAMGLVLWWVRLLWERVSVPLFGL